MRNLRSTGSASGIESPQGTQPSTFDPFGDPARKGHKPQTWPAPETGAGPRKTTKSSKVQSAPPGTGRGTKGPGREEVGGLAEPSTADLTQVIFLGTRSFAPSASALCFGGHVSRSQLIADSWLQEICVTVGILGLSQKATEPRTSMLKALRCV